MAGYFERSACPGEFDEFLKTFNLGIDGLIIGLDRGSDTLRTDLLSFLFLRNA